MTLNIVVVTISDTRTHKTDESGGMLEKYVTESGHRVVERQLVKDDTESISKTVQELSRRSDVDVIITTGGTGITRRDVTPEAISPLADKHIPGFGELFRMLSFQEIGSSTIQSRADAWLCAQTLVFALPGSPNAIRLAWTQILSHQLNSEHKPCNFVQLKPRF